MIAKDDQENSPPPMKRPKFVLPTNAKRIPLLSAPDSTPNGNIAKVFPVSMIGHSGQKSSISDYLECARTLQSAAENARPHGYSQQILELDPTSFYGHVHEYAYWARIDENLYNDAETTERINKAYATESSYRRDKEKSIARMYGFLESHPNVKIRELADSLPDPNVIDCQERRFILLTRGLKDENKRELVDRVMTIFAVNMHKLSISKEQFHKATGKEKADAKYKPGSILTFYKHIFSHLSEKQVNYTLGEFANKKGSFHAALKMDYEETLKHRPDYGVRKSAPVDLNAAQKVRDSRIDPYQRSMIDPQMSGFDWCMRIIAHSMGEIFMLRGGKEVSECCYDQSVISIIQFLLTMMFLQPANLMYSDFTLDFQKGGPFDGRRFLQLNSFGAAGNADKTCKLSLGNPYIRDASGYYKIYENPGDKFCLIKLYVYYVTEHLLPAMAHEGKEDHWFFIRRAPQKVLNERRKKFSLKTEAGLHHNQKWGEQNFSVQMKKLAERCGFEKASEYTMRSNRQAGITKLASSSLATNNVMQAARHASVEANRLYQVENEDDHVARSLVFHHRSTNASTMTISNNTNVASIATHVENAVPTPLTHKAVDQSTNANPMTTSNQTSLPTNQSTLMNPNIPFVNGFPSVVNPFDPQNASFSNAMQNPMAGMMGMMGMGMMCMSMMGSMMGMNSMFPTHPSISTMAQNSYNHGNHSFQSAQPVNAFVQHASQRQQKTAQDTQQSVQQQSTTHIPESSYQCKLLQYDSDTPDVEEWKLQHEDTSDEEDNAEDTNRLIPQFTQTQSYNSHAKQFSQVNNGASV
jgi:hypothetical protein